MDKKSEFNFVNTFPPLGHPEHHFNKYPNHPWLKDESQIKMWIMENLCTLDGLGSVKESEFINKFIVIHDDLTVSIHRRFVTKRHIKRTDIFGHIPVQFRECDSMKIEYAGLKTAIGTPYIVSVLDLSNNQLNSWEGISENIKDRLELFKNEISGFEGMPDFKNEITIDMNYNNVIQSWYGFRGMVKSLNITDMPSNDIFLTDAEMIEFIENTPDSIKELRIEYLEERNSGIVFVINEDISDIVDVDYMKKLKDIKNANESIVEIDFQIDKNKKRKI